MFLVRNAKPSDSPTLSKLARMVYFINLPPDERLITAKIEHAQQCFLRAAGGVAPASRRRRPMPPERGFAAIETASDLFMFTIEDIHSKGVVGTSQVRAHQGGPGDPNWSLRLSEKRFFSEKLGQGTVHTVAKLHGDESGPSELGGLILQPSYRGHPHRPGRLLSYARFHFIALHRELFADRLLAEMMGPVSSEGESAFWDAFGRKFIPVRFAEADRFCQHNRGFIHELMPKEEVYLTLLPLEIQNLVGVVSRETLPARRLLEKLGFQYRNHIDPFDGGPHLDAPTDSVPLVRDTTRLKLGRALAPARCEHHALVSTLTAEGEFRAVETPCSLAEREVRLPAEALKALDASPSQTAGVTPLPAPNSPEQPPPDSAPSRAKRRKARA